MTEGIQDIAQRTIDLPDSEEKAIALNQLAWDLRYNDIKSAKEHAAEALALSNKLNYPAGSAHASLIITLADFWMATDADHLSQVTQLITQFRELNDLLGLTRSLVLSANMYDQYGEYDKVIEQCHEAIGTAKKTDEPKELSDCLTIQGQVYSRIGDYDKAIKSLEESKAIREEVGDQPAIGASLNQLARIYSLKKNFEQSENYYRQSLELRERLNDTNGLPWTHLGLASLYQEMGNEEAALEHYKNGMSLNTKNDKRYELLCHLGIGRINTGQGNLEEATSQLSIALRNAEELKSKPLMADVQQALAETHEKDNDAIKALKHFKTYLKLKEEVLNAETANRLKNKEIAFSVEKAEKEAEIHRLRNVELREANEQIEYRNLMLEEKNKEIMDSLNYARRIQHAILPSTATFKSNFSESFIIFLPKDVVSGDFYWTTQHGSRRYFAAVDCTGHGVPGAFVSIVGHHALNRCINEFELIHPHHILDKLNELVEATFANSEREVRDGMDIALCCIDESSGTLEYAGANNPLYYLHNDEIEEIKADKQPIGKFDTRQPFTNHVIDVRKGDSIYVFSDGLADQFGGPGGKKFKYKPFRELLLSLQNTAMEEQGSIISDKFREWKGELEQIDDVCVIGVKI